MSNMTPEIKIKDDGLIRIDGVPAFRMIVREDVIYLQFFDKDRLRSQCRGSRFVEISLDELVEKMNEKGKADGQES